MPSSLNGTGVTFNDATTLQSGAIPAANLGTGSPGSGNFLRGDRTWATVPASAPSTADVLNATAGASVGAVGTYAFLHRPDQGVFTFGATLAGSGLVPNSVSPGDSPFIFPSSPAQTGTWRAFGASSGNATSNRYGTLFLRIS